MFRCLTGHTPLRYLHPDRYADQVRRYARRTSQSFVAGGYTQPIRVQSCHIVPRLASTQASIQAGVQTIVQAAQAAQAAAQAGVQAAQAGRMSEQAAMQVSMPTDMPTTPATTPITQTDSSTQTYTFDICGSVQQGEDVFAFWALYTTIPAAEHLMMHSLRVILPPARM
ncbi:hypothetical protein [Corynebacterium sp. HS2168-gen11]|uniref:hypothetical protein n=1 Tax=Corynebacterium sp. HS2168-gen11 TaxID=2974027 RepID=UPI00216B2C7F|nr:hypothetical protein [Corynebacterium sp. HS2168-gen11]MCS4535838.1 hypothetical protein [Corynebacterium sp. HS2168-gen11]